MANQQERDLRTAVFQYVASIGDTLTWKQLKSFEYRGEVVHLIGQPGIWKPKQLTYPISITTAAPKPGRPAPYDDEISDDLFLSYRYQGVDPDRWDNTLLKRAEIEAVPMLYLHGIATGTYEVSGASIISHDDHRLTFNVALSPVLATASGLASGAEATGQGYYLTTVKQRINQGVFREGVLNAYRSSCAICTLKHVNLLDAAHIKPHATGGTSTVPNGVALCKIHHAAFDHNIIGIRPDMTAAVREDVLEEVDGPMLKHGIQEVHDRKLIVPRRPAWQPDSDALEERFEAFLSA